MPDYIFLFFSCDTTDFIVRISRYNKSSEDVEVEVSLSVKEYFLLTVSTTFANLVFVELQLMNLNLEAHSSRQFQKKTSFHALLEICTDRCRGLWPPYPFSISIFHQLVQKEICLSSHNITFANIIILKQKPGKSGIVDSLFQCKYC